MSLIFKIAWRNILRHKGRSIIIGVILFLGALLMTVGSSVISGMDRGLEKNIVNGFLGDIVIISDKEKSDNILFKLYGESVDTITNYKDIKKILTTEEYIKGFLPIGKNVTTVLNEEDGDPGFAMVLGVDFKEYCSFFPDNFKPIEGGVMKNGEAGIIIPVKTRKDLYDLMNVWLIPEKSQLIEENFSDEAKENKNELKVKNTAVFMGMSSTNSTSDIRLTVKGIMKYNALNTIWGHFSIMDIESYRKCLGYFGASEKLDEIDEEKKKLLSLETENIDNLFGSTDVLVSESGTSNSKVSENRVLVSNSATLGIADIDFRKKEELSASTTIDLEAGVYNLVLVKLKDNVKLEDGVKRLNNTLASNTLTSNTLASSKLGVRAVTWKKASGFIGSMATIIKGALFLFVAFLFFVAIIIIVNTLTMAAIERTTEIGMMRAIGARKSMITGMFIGETSILSGLFGGIGIIIGIVIVQIIPLFNITSENDIVQLLFGGDTFHPFLSMSDILVVIFELILVTFITVIYPVMVAINITPLDAIARD